MNLRSTEWSGEEEKKKHTTTFGTAVTLVCQRHTNMQTQRKLFTPLYIWTAASKSPFCNYPWQDAVPPDEWLKIKRYINNTVFREAEAQIPSHPWPAVEKRFRSKVFTPVAVKQNNEFWQDTLKMDSSSSSDEGLDLNMLSKKKSIPSNSEGIQRKSFTSSYRAGCW